LFTIESPVNGPLVSQQACFANMLALWPSLASQNYTLKHISPKQGPFQETLILLFTKRWKSREALEGVVPKKYGDRRIDEERQASHLRRRDHLQLMADAKSGMDAKRYVFEDANFQRQLFHFDSRYQ
jgi:hypothetical protein